MYTSDIRSDLSALLGGTNALSDNAFGLGGGNTTSGLGLGSAPFETLLAQVILRLIDRLDAQSPAGPTASAALTTATSVTAPQTAAVNTASGWVYATPLAEAAIAKQAYASAPVSQPRAVSQPATTALALTDYPHPPQDNGRGMHWIPTVAQTPEVVDRYVAQLKDMHIKWVTFLNDGSAVGANDYLVQQLKANGIEPVLRVYTDGLKPINGDLAGMVRHYKALGVSYFQLYNEPNVTAENNGQTPDVNRYLDTWLPAAKVVTENGGLPGFGALSPGGEAPDTDFLAQALDGLKARGELGALDQAWLSIHNYQGDRPVDDPNGFARFKVYADVLQQKLGRLLPMIGTEGGTFTATPQGEAHRTQLVTDAYRYMSKREPYNFAYSYWVVANTAGGGHDPAWESQALFQKDGHSPLVDALKSLQ